MDIVPGYRLVHINELDDTTRPFHAAWPELARFVPFLADYGANYYLVGSSDETVGHLDRVEGFAKVACSLDAF
jgi:hypothetical protein